MCQDLITLQKEFFAAGHTRIGRYRLGVLGALYQAVLSHHAELLAALGQAGLDRRTALVQELLPLLAHIEASQRGLLFARKAPLAKGCAAVRAEGLLLAPLAAAAAALGEGNCVLLHLSENPLAEPIAALLEETFDPCLIAVGETDAADTVITAVPLSPKKSPADPEKALTKRLKRAKIV